MKKNWHGLLCCVIYFYGIRPVRKFAKFDKRHFVSKKCAQSERKHIPDWAEKSDEGVSDTWYADFPPKLFCPSSKYNFVDT